MTELFFFFFLPPRCWFQRLTASVKKNGTMVNGWWTGTWEQIWHYLILVKIPRRTEKKKVRITFCFVIGPTGYKEVAMSNGTQASRQPRKGATFCSYIFYFTTWAVFGSVALGTFKIASRATHICHFSIPLFYLLPLAGSTLTEPYKQPLAWWDLLRCTSTRRESKEPAQRQILTPDVNMWTVLAGKELTPK